MNVLLLNGSPRKDGCTARALREVAETLEKEGIAVETLHIGKQNIHGCVACNGCARLGHCVYQDDLLPEAAEKFERADGLVVGSPVYYASANGTIISLLDRLFYSTSFDKTMKVGAAVVSCRRGGNTAAFDELNKYFTISGMPIASSRYWNMVHGFTKEDVEKDLEGLQTMRVLARNMAFLLRAIAAEKEKNGLPPKEEQAFFTSFPDGK